MHHFNLRLATFKQTLVYAKLLAGMTNEEIAEAAGIGGARVARYFQEFDSYTPSPALVPPLCRALGNKILIEWQMEQVTDLPTVNPIGTASELVAAVLRATTNVGDLSAKAEIAVADGTLSVEEARAIQEQFRKNREWCKVAVAALEKLARGEKV
jgi:transcriptional regulator with XRE-family HTH domain